MEIRQWPILSTYCFEIPKCSTLQKQTSYFQVAQQRAFHKYFEEFLCFPLKKDKTQKNNIKTTTEVATSHLRCFSKCLRWKIEGMQISAHHLPVISYLYLDTDSKFFQADQKHRQLFTLIKATYFFFFNYVTINYILMIMELNSLFSHSTSLTENLILLLLRWVIQYFQNYVE